MERYQEKLKHGKVLKGTHIFNDDLLTAHLISECGFDYLWIDMEHTELGKREVRDILLACHSGDKKPARFVRVPKNDPDIVKPILDMGADGIIFPMICTREDVERAVASCYYPPKGVRGFFPREAIRHGLDDVSEYIKISGDRIWKLIQIETKQAYENLDDILENKQVDAFIIGPMDSSGAFGHLGDYHHPEVLSQIKTAIQKIRKAGRIAAVSVGDYDKETVRFWLDLGVNMISMGSECGYILDGCRKTLENMEQAIVSDDIITRRFYESYDADEYLW